MSGHDPFIFSSFSIDKELERLSFCVGQSELWGRVGSVASHTTAIEGSWCVQRLHLSAASSLSLSLSLDSLPIVFVIWQEIGTHPTILVSLMPPSLFFLPFLYSTFGPSLSPTCHSSYNSHSLLHTLPLSTSKSMDPISLHCVLLLLGIVTFAGLERVKVYDTDPAVLKALSGSGVKVTVDLPNELLYSAAKYPAFARSWVQKNIVAYHPSTQIEAIAVVSSPIALSALQSSYPSSTGSFRPELIEQVFKPMLDFLRQTGSYLMVNAYPFFAYEFNSDVISLDYALFRENPGVVDSGNGLRYHNLFDAQIDAVFAALSTLNYDDVKIVVTETRWPSKGDENEVGASVENAVTYNGNLIRRILTCGGTPLRPQTNLTVFLFALFNKNEKDGPTSERNYGLFYPDQQKVYDIPFTVEGLKNYKAQPPVTGDQRVAASVRGGVSKSTTGNTWCVANPDVGKERLQAAMDFACGEGGADCRPIQPEATCYNPNTLEAHSSFAFNSYYQKKGRVMGDCYFGGAAYVVTQEPSAYFIFVSFRVFLFSLLLAKLRMIS
ncbi:hypothetical protein SADUNF_Sadunf14G0120500 [Salix dunnii]|uniref:glucan endo-1,3-beta-D-glucosidase n=1 Tax=Salix dunnii TaxID=1413687 RepID=A0A835MK67_9ROSI|nr:hypothetical protein SADUNF_Sadunf14G0120500 [Salix dunnii]